MKSSAFGYSSNTLINITINIIVFFQMTKDIEQKIFINITDLPKNPNHYSIIFAMM
jgi:hypothetical protein